MIFKLVFCSAYSYASTCLRRLHNLMRLRTVTQVNSTPTSLRAASMSIFTHTNARMYKYRAIEFYHLSQCTNASKCFPFVSWRERARCCIRFRRSDFLKYLSLSLLLSKVIVRSSSSSSPCIASNGLDGINTAARIDKTDHLLR